MAKKKGNEELLYLATSTPTIATDKDDAAYSLLTNVKSTSLSIESDEVDGADKDTGSFGDPYPGLKNITLEVTFNRDFAGATAQDAVEAAGLATTAAGATLWGILTTAVTADTGRHFSGRVLNFSISSDAESIGEASMTMRLIGAYTTFTEA